MAGLKFVYTSDRVDVVRCRDCRWGVACRDMICCTGTARAPMALVDPDWYCADGTKGEDAHGKQAAQTGPGLGGR